MVRVVLGVILAVTVGLLGHGEARAQQTLKLVTGNQYQPYTDEALPYGGLGTMIVKAVFENMRQPTEIIFADWDEGYKGTLEGRYAATFPYILTTERDAEMLFSDPLFVVRPTVFTRANSLSVVAKVEDLKGKVMCRPASWAVDRYLRDWVDGGHIQVADLPSVPDCFRALNAGTVDFISVDRLLGAITASAINPTPGWIRQGQLVKQGNPNFLIMAKSNPNAPAILEAFNRSMGQLTQRGVMGQLVQRFFELAK